MRTIFEFSEENAKIADCLADGAVSRELLSAVKIPWWSGKIQGTSRIRGAFAASSSPKVSVSNGLFLQIPYST